MCTPSHHHHHHHNNSDRKPTANKDIHSEVRSLIPGQPASGAQPSLNAAAAAVATATTATAAAGTARARQVASTHAPTWP